MKAPLRFDTIDALRGVAIVWMTLFHFFFDLSFLGFARENFYRDPFWTWQRVAIVSLFLFCAGLGQAVAWQQGQSWPRFWRRWFCLRWLWPTLRGTWWGSAPARHLGVS